MVTGGLTENDCNDDLYPENAVTSTLNVTGVGVSVPDHVTCRVEVVCAGDAAPSSPESGGSGANDERTAIQTERRSWKWRQTE